MNTKFRFTRFVLALILVISALAIPASAVIAAPPVKVVMEFPMGGIIDDVCAFPIEWSGWVRSPSILFFDNAGNFIGMNFNSVQTDTFSANGKTLVGLPHRYAGQYFVDSNGIPTQFYRTGVQEKVRLPDGSLFISAGRLDWVTNTSASLILIPEEGGSSNLAGFCAALAP